MIESKLIKLIYELLQYRRSYIEDTVEFTKWKHNSKLCPMFQEKIELVVSSFEKYGKITYDMQGVNDKGTDILLRITENNESKYICFQIKSEDDLKNPDYLKILKAQFFDTQQKYSGFEDYYIIVCCDVTNRRNKDKIRSIEAEMSKEAKIHVIEPQYTLSFIKLADTTIDAFIKNKLCNTDIVFRKALNIINELTPSEMAVMIYIIYLQIFLEKQYVTANDILNSSFIQEIYNETPDYSREYFFEDTCEDEEDLEQRNLENYTRLMYDLDYLCDNCIYSDYNNMYKISLEDIYAIVIIMLDGNIRYGYKSNELLRYMMHIKL